MRQPLRCHRYAAPHYAGHMSSPPTSEADGYIYGHMAYQTADGAWRWAGTDQPVAERVHSDDPTDQWTHDGVSFNVPPCPACNRRPIFCALCPDEPYHDACLGHIEGVRSACCGHGVYTGQIIWPGVSPSRIVGGSICNDDQSPLQEPQAPMS